MRKSWYGTFLRMMFDPIRLNFPFTRDEALLLKARQLENYAWVMARLQSAGHKNTCTPLA